MGIAVASFDLKNIQWESLSDEGEAWLARKGNLASDGQLVRSTSRRRVLRLDGCYIKEVCYSGWRSVIKRVGGGNALREGRTSQRLAAMGVTVPVVLGFGRQTRFGLLARDVLLTREVTDAEPLRQLMFNVYPFLSAAEKRAFAVRFSAFICNLHDLGVEHRDLHIGNILVQGELTGGQFLLLDTDRVRCHPGSLGMRKRAANLAQVLMNFWKLSNRSERFRFLRNYLKEQRLNAGFASLIETDSLKQARRSWHKRAVLALSNGPHFKLGRRDGWSFWRSTSSEASNVQQILLPEPDQILCGGRTLKAGNTVTAAEISTGASRFFLKRYNDKGSWYRFRNAFRRSRALRTWIMSWEFIERGLPVPLPLICIEKRRWLMLRQTYLASCFIEGWRLPEYWQSASASEQAALLVRIALVLGKMHRSGCIHGDLKWNNLLVDANGAVHLIDLDGSYVSRWISRHRTKDIRRFVANMQRYRLDDKEQRLFLSVWKRWATPM